MNFNTKPGKVKLTKSHLQSMPDVVVYLFDAGISHSDLNGTSESLVLIFQLSLEPLGTFYNNLPHPAFKMHGVQAQWLCSSLLRQSALAERRENMWLLVRVGVSFLGGVWGGGSLVCSTCQHLESPVPGESL